MNSETYNWYSALLKPTWSPPSWVFGPVWSVLYTIIAVTYGTVFYKAYTGQLPLMVALPFALNLIFNFSFTYFQFGLKNNLLATPHLGSLCALSILTHQPHRNRRPQPRLDHLRQHSIPPLGLYCDGVAINDYLDE